MTNTKRDYILGTDDQELERLLLQHRIWADATVAAWKRAGVGPGKNVLDMGSGPGAASFDMAQLVTTSGQVMAIDESEKFISSILRKAEDYELPQIKARVGDVQNLSAALDKTELFDVIYCRWVLCWLKEPERALANCTQFLKPGGRLVIHDYFNWGAMSMAPRSKALDRVMEKTLESFKDRGGDIDISARILPLLRKNNFELNHFEVHQRVPRGGGLDGTAAWPITWWRIYAPKLIELGKLTSSEVDAALRDIDQLEKNPDTFFFCPPLFEFIATKN